MRSVLVALETCDLPRYVSRSNKVLTTWVRDLPLGYDFIVATGDKLGLKSDTWYDLGAKTQALCRYALARGYDALFIVDDDVYIRTRRLAVPFADYAGHVGPPTGDKPHSYCWGAAYWLSPKAMAVVARAEIDDNVEDRWIGGVLYGAGILPTDLPDYVKSPCLCGRCSPPELTNDWTVLLELIVPGNFDRAAAAESKTS
jgi:hypothetical protein